MKGSEHYREAQLHLRGAATRVEASGEVDAFATYLLAAAQAHATLAAAAASVATFAGEFAELEGTAAEWIEATT